MIIRQAPTADQPTIQPAMTVIIAQAGIGGTCTATPPPSPTWTPPGQRGRLQLIHGKADTASPSSTMADSGAVPNAMTSDATTAQTARTASTGHRRFAKTEASRPRRASGRTAVRTTPTVISSSVQRLSLRG